MRRLLLGNASSKNLAGASSCYCRRYVLFAPSTYVRSTIIGEAELACPSSQSMESAVLKSSLLLLPRVVLWCHSMYFCLGEASKLCWRFQNFSQMTAPLHQNFSLLFQYRLLLLP